jgi:hypothetical protein
LGQDEENEARPNGINQKEEVQTEEPEIIKGGGHEDKEPPSSPIHDSTA